MQIGKLSFQDEAPAEKEEWGYYPELQDDFNNFSFDHAASKLDQPVFSESRSSFVESPYMPALSWGQRTRRKDSPRDENEDVKSKLHNKRLNQTAATNVQPRRDSESGKGGAKRSKRIANEKYKVTMTYIET